MAPQPSDRQLEKHIRQSADNTANVGFTRHALAQMRQRCIGRAMVMEALRMGRLALTPEPAMKFTGLNCRMQRFVAGVNVAVVVYVEHPAPGLTVVTVIDVKRD